VDTTAPAPPQSTSPSSISERKPILAGLAEAGATVILEIDLDGNGVTDVAYTTLVDGTGAWAVNTATAAPSSGVLPASGFPIPTIAHLRARAQDLAGNVSAPTSWTLDLGYRINLPITLR
jgi:hypothetical protein